MKSTVLLAGIFLFTASCVFAEEATGSLSAEEIAVRRERMMTKTGGMIDFPGKGKILYVNCQSKISAYDVQKRCDKIQYVTKFPCEVREGTWKFGDTKPSDASIAIFIIDDESLPMSLVAVEAGWAVVNTATLKLEPRFSKELTRVTTLLGGAGYSPIATSVMHAVKNPSDLDKAIDGFTMDMYNAILGNLKGLGMAPMRKTTYLKACQEGWAPAPSNDYQKAIWNQTHEIPTEPLKIEYKK